MPSGRSTRSSDACLASEVLDSEAAKNAKMLSRFMGFGGDVTRLFAYLNGPDFQNIYGRLIAMAARYCQARAIDRGPWPAQLRSFMNKYRAGLRDHIFACQPGNEASQVGNKPSNFISWVGWAVYWITEKAKTKGGPFYKTFVPPEGMEGRIYYCIRFCANGRVPHQPGIPFLANLPISLAAEPANLNIDLEGEESIDVLVAKRCQLRLQTTVNMADPGDLDTDFGRWAQIEHGIKLSYPGAQDTFTSDLGKLKLENRSVLDSARIVHTHQEDSRNLAEMDLRWYQELAKMTSIPGEGSITKSLHSADTSATTKLEEVMANTAYDRVNLPDALTLLTNGGLRHDPLTNTYSWLHSSDNKRIHPHQVTGAAALVQAIHDNTHGLNGHFLGDATGLGKTLVLAIVISNEITWKEEQGIHQPTLVLLPNDTLFQPMIDHIINNDHRAEIFTYYGRGEDSRHHQATAIRQDEFTSNHELFDGTPDRAKAVVVSTIRTWQSRHGSSAQNDWLSKRGEQDDPNINENWPGWLGGKFALVIVDEAHYVKSRASQANEAVHWLKPCFTILSSATPASNNIGRDLDGYIRLFEPTDVAWPRSSSYNPFNSSMPNIPHQISTPGFSRFVAHEKDLGVQAQYVKQMYSVIMTRRLYRSKDPSDATKTIGDLIPSIKTITFQSRYRTEVQAEYMMRSHNPRKHLYTTDAVTGELRWNGQCFRELVLYSSCVYFSTINQGMRAENIADWRRAHPEDRLPHLVNCIKDAERKEKKLGPGDSPDTPFIIPSRSHVYRWLAIIIEVFPKLEILLRVVQEKVLWGQEKIGVVVMYPAMLMLIGSILDALRINHEVLGADLSPDAKAAAIHRFTSSNNGPMIFLFTYATGGVGINLHHTCRTMVSVDTPLNSGQEAQAIGRFRRIGQEREVHHIELVMLQTFQPVLRAKLQHKRVAIDLADINEDIVYEEVIREGGVKAPVSSMRKKFYAIHGELKEESDLTPAEKGALGNALPLKPADFMAKLQDSCSEMIHANTITPWGSVPLGQ